MVWKLAVVEQDPAQIWTCIEKTFGFGFFNKQIEFEFGINPTTHEAMAFDFAKQVEEIRRLASDKFHKLTVETERIVDGLWKQIQDKNEEIIRQKESFLMQKLQIREDVEAELKILYDEREAHFFEKLDSDKEQLFKIISELEEEI